MPQLASACRPPQEKTVRVTALRRHRALANRVFAVITKAGCNDVTVA